MTNDEIRMTNIGVNAFVAAGQFVIRHSSFKHSSFSSMLSAKSQYACLAMLQLAQDYSSGETAPVRRESCGSSASGMAVVSTGPAGIRGRAA